ncbi:hypothetical protein [Pseudorhodobacter aquimaris]|uniref:hypothetical protein n=1 Tax=Pseudorhodobacter aquimaris TaxID=687412 RepID=UPI00067BD86E|nr:hypothetical protein [Pseudorhodobacter aquimaris]
MCHLSWFESVGGTWSVRFGFLEVIRKLMLRDKMPIREIARRMGVSCNTIKYYLWEGITEPAFQAPDRRSRQDLYAKRNAEWLMTDQRKSGKGVERPSLNISVPAAVAR